VVLSLLILALIVGCGDDDDKSTGPQDVLNLVWVDSVSATVGTQAVVGVHLKSSNALLGAEVPLKLSGTGFTIDSGSFVGGVFAGAILKSCSVDVATQTVFMLTTSLSSIAAGEGLFGNLYVSIDPGAAVQVIAVDSALVPVGGNVYHVVSFVKSDLGQVLPPFQPGKIIVEPVL